MADRVTVTLHELVAELDLYAEAWLQQHHGVSYKLFEFLATLSTRQPIDITGLARYLGVSKAAVSKRVPALADAGWIATAPGGGRRILLTLTEQGADLVQRAGGELEAEFTALFADPRLAPMPSSDALNHHLRILTEIILTHPKGPQQ